MTFPPLAAHLAERTVPALLDAAVAATPQRTALIAPSLLTGDVEERLAWSELADRAGVLAGALQERGVGKGDRVAIIVGNDGTVEAHLAYHASHRLGAVNVPVNTRYVDRELRYVLGFTEPAAIVFASEFAPVLERALGDDRPVLLEAGRDARLGEPLHRALEDPGRLPDGVAVGEHDDADWIFTSGTTGHPKAVALTHANSVACGHQATGLWGLGITSVYQSSAPFFTSTGCHTNLLACLAARCTYVVEPAFDVRATIARAARHGTTSLFLVSSMLALMFHRLTDDELRALDVRSLERLCYGGQSMGRAFYERVLEVFGPAGHDLDLVHLYGLTEGGTCGLLLDPDEHSDAVRDRCGPHGLTIGRRGFTDWVEHRVVREDGSDVEPGEVGEIRLRAPSVMSRYVGDEAATAATLEGGWLHTGDMATVDDDGFVYFVDRAKQMIRRAGLNISSAEVEGVVCEHPAVEEAAAVPKPDGVLGETVHVVVVARTGAELSEEDLVAHCRERLADYKVPASVAFADALPRNAMGRVVKGELMSQTVPQEAR